jgi:hypothetical protein
VAVDGSKIRVTIHQPAELFGDRDRSHSPGTLIRRPSPRGSSPGTATCDEHAIRAIRV